MKKQPLKETLKRIGGNRLLKESTWDNRKFGEPLPTLKSEMEKHQSKKQNIKEVILALSTTMEGQTTSHVIADKLEPLQIEVSRLAQGIPFGGAVHYLDENTLSTAFQSRKKIN